MKQIFRAGIVALISLFSIFFLLFAQSFVADTQLLPQRWFSFEPGEEFELAGSSRFIEDMKQVKFYPNVSAFLRRMGDSKSSLGVRFSWDRVGTHFADVIPKSRRYLNNRLKKISMWVWGGNYKHELGLVFTRESDGFSYVISMGKLDYYGWKSHIVSVPSLVGQKKRSSASAVDRFHFDRFRIYSDPGERVDNIYVFFDNLNVEEEVSTYRYDGSDLGDIILKELRGSEGEKKSEGSDRLMNDSGAADQDILGNDAAQQGGNPQQ